MCASRRKIGDKLIYSQSASKLDVQIEIARAEEGSTGSDDGKGLSPSVAI
jgi:hypothetical protein